MADEMTLETRLILARYEDITAQYTARVNTIGEEFAAELARHDAEAAERDRLAAERQPAIEAAHQAAKEEYLRAKAEAEARPTPWVRENRPQVLSFSTEDDPAPDPVPRQAAPAFTPPPAFTAPAGFAPPAAVELPQAPAPESSREHYLSIGSQDEDATPPRPPRPAPPRRAPAADDQEDDDWSGRSWVR
ncbi:hypothetical protein [Actinokineospora sp. NBRC 105648]|uniref:hypothetical protein n=1 Tax=Actinokineospora sp. NBRC 105648 TaxID=3032206 RepID=UPI0024A23C1B|nr:hypothetical protein [Actinokineospora sp. NBRC 105648]GLZ42107.1 hypothetical protein Acsp05_57310 [Actinokineospora sp. NBRC 105648]